MMDAKRINFSTKTSQPLMQSTPHASAKLQNSITLIIFLSATDRDKTDVTEPGQMAYQAGKPGFGLKWFAVAVAPGNRRLYRVDNYLFDHGPLS